MDYYFIFIWGLVEPELIGPFENSKERNIEAKKYWKQHRDQHGYFQLEVTKGSEVDVSCFCSEVFEE